MSPNAKAALLREHRRNVAHFSYHLKRMKEGQQPSRKMESVAVRALATLAKVR